jgi:hypothetical protein
MKHNAKLPGHVASAYRLEWYTQMRKRLEHDEMARGQIRIIKTVKQKMLTFLLRLHNVIKETLIKLRKHMVHPKLTSGILVGNAIENLITLRR